MSKSDYCNNSTGSLFLIILTATYYVAKGIPLLPATGVRAGKRVYVFAVARITRKIDVITSRTGHLVARIVSTRRIAPVIALSSNRVRRDQYDSQYRQHPGYRSKNGRNSFHMGSSYYALQASWDLHCMGTHLHNEKLDVL